MSSSLIRGRYVVTGCDDRQHAEVITDGAIVQVDGTIAEVGTFADLSKRHRVDQIIGSPNDVVTPGFVNSHHHVGLTPFQMGSPDLPLELWIARRLGTRDVDPYLDTLYSAFEMIRSGVTTVQHIHMRARGSAERVLSTANEIIRAYNDVGMRVSYSFGIRDQNRIVYESDCEFYSRLPSELGQLLSAYVASTTLGLDEGISIFEKLYRKFKDAERVRIQLAPANLHWCSDLALESLRDCSNKYGVPLHMHLLETPFQKEYAKRRTGGVSAVAHLRRLGLLTPQMTLGHGVWLADSDIELLAAAGAHVCHNCSSNLRLRSGTANLNLLEERGVNVAIGIDEAGINDDRDMLQEMRLVLRQHRVPGMGGGIPTSTQVFRMATVGGAVTTPFGSSIGKAIAGSSADFVIFDWSRLTHPYLDPGVGVVDAIIYRAKPSSVKSVMVGGEVIYHEGKFTRLDQENALKELASQLQRPLTVEEENRRQLAIDILPYVERFYRESFDETIRFTNGLRSRSH